MHPVVVVVESDFLDEAETLAAYRRRVTPPRPPSLTRRAITTTTRRSLTMKKTVLAAAVAVLALVGASSASAAPAKYAQFSESTAANGAHAYARAHMGAASSGTFSPGLKTVVDCMAVRTGVTHRSALWLCDVTTYQGRADEAGHALVGVLRKGGSYVFRTYHLVEEVAR